MLGTYKVKKERLNWVYVIMNSAPNGNWVGTVFKSGQWYIANWSSSGEAFDKDSIHDLSELEKISDGYSGNKMLVNKPMNMLQFMEGLVDSDKNMILDRKNNKYNIASISITNIYVYIGDDLGATAPFPLSYEQLASEGCKFTDGKPCSIEEEEWV